MNESTEKLIRELAEKLGTTTEHLWEVMVKQAFYSGVIDLIQYGLLGVALIAYYKVGLVKFKVWEKADFIPGIGLLLVVGLVLSFVTMFAMFSFGDTIIAFVNPEYWALKKILSRRF